MAATKTTAKTCKHYHVWVSAWRDGEPPKAMFRRGIAYPHRTQANRAKRSFTQDPRDITVILACENPACKVHGK